MIEMSKAEAHVALQSDDTFQQGVKDCLPTVFGYLSIGIAAGVIAKTAGFSIIEIAFMSTLIYAGSAQFILAGMYAAGAPASAIILLYFVNLRHLLMSAALAPYFTKLPLLKMSLSVLKLQMKRSALQCSMQRKRIFRRKMDDWAKCNGLFKLDSCYYHWRVIW